MFKKGLLALALVFSLPVFAAEHWIDVRVPEQYQQEHVQGASVGWSCFEVPILSRE